MQFKKVSTAKKYAKPANSRTRTSKYDPFIDAGIALVENEGVAAPFETSDEATAALNGLRGRLKRRGLYPIFTAYIVEGTTVVLTKKSVPDEVADADADGGE